MSEKKVTDLMLDRIKYFINAIENGEYEPTGYRFTVSMQLSNLKEVAFSDDNIRQI